MAKYPRPSMQKLLLKQLGMALTIVVFLTIVFPEYWLSLLTAFGVALIPQLVFNLLMFRYAGARQQLQQLKALFLGAALKFGLAVALFVLVFVLVPPANPILFLSAYVSIVLLNWLNPWLVK